GALDLAIAQDLGHRLGMSIDNALLYQRAQRALRMREDVLSIVSHDLRDLLNAILMRAQLLAASFSPRHAQSILGAGKRMERLIDDLLDVASIDAGRLSIVCGSYPARQLVAEALETLAPAAADKAITLVNAVGHEDVRVACDHGRTLQVLSNLIGNAVKFTPRGGSVTVGAKPQGPCLCFSVTDTGPGIPAQHASLLFDRFWQAAPAFRQGAGLGLYIAKGIVEAHGGRLWVESTVGVGT